MLSERFNVDQDWKKYLNYLDNGAYSVDITTSNLSPTKSALEKKYSVIKNLKYNLWSFQKKILTDIHDSTLILGLPTGLGKTYLAGAKLFEESSKKPIRVLFLVPSIPLGVQQTIFIREKLGINAFFVSGGLSPNLRKELCVWNNAFVVTTPQTFYNDLLANHENLLKEFKSENKSLELLSTLFDRFPFDIVVADECQRYIGETCGYYILLSAQACNAKILALSATPQLHSRRRLFELKKIFKKIKVVSIEDPGIKEHMPDRLLETCKIDTPKKLLKVYHAFGKLAQNYSFRISKTYGYRHPRNCSQHPLCQALLAVRMLRLRLVEDGASSVINYGTWKFRDLSTRRSSLEGNSLKNAYNEALQECFNHKLIAVETLLYREKYRKAIIYVESVEAAKQLAVKLQKNKSFEEIACLVGKGNMSMNQQASSLFQFRKSGNILVCTSVGEEGLDIPSADLEIWVEPPSNPQKWIQRFGRILRQPGDKKVAKTIAIVSKQTHEEKKLLSVKREVENVYGFTQRLETNSLKSFGNNQKTMFDYF